MPLETRGLEDSTGTIRRKLGYKIEQPVSHKMDGDSYVDFNDEASRVVHNLNNVEAISREIKAREATVEQAKINAKNDGDWDAIRHQLATIEELKKRLIN